MPAGLLSPREPHSAGHGSFFPYTTSPFTFLFHHIARQLRRSFECMSFQDWFPRLCIADPTVTWSGTPNREQGRRRRLQGCCLRWCWYPRLSGQWRPLARPVLSFSTWLRGRRPRRVQQRARWLEKRRGECPLVQIHFITDERGSRRTYLRV